MSTLASVLKISEDQAFQVVRELLQLGYIQLDRTLENDVDWYRRRPSTHSFYS